MADNTRISWFDDSDHPDRWAVHVQIPPDLDRCPIIRSVAGCAMTIDGWEPDDVIDIRLAIDEVCTQVVAAAVPGSAVDVALGSGGGRLIGLVAGELHPAATIDVGGFGWPLVAAVTDVQEVKYRDADCRTVEVRIIKQRSNSASPIG